MILLKASKNLDTEKAMTEDSLRIFGLFISKSSLSGLFLSVSADLSFFVSFSFVSVRVLCFCEFL